ncbi:ExbD/TolR family protein [Ningiella sp. W23]|uniref:ExbD/TolR family protein n=1 Tax=Ningiella sp. W23 TaxID=3023715 RepID=UPI00375758A3
MKQSMRAKRMERHHKRNQKSAKLSLVSLMDIFTILVFFLMFNASDVQVLQSSDQVNLPQSTAETPADENILLMVTSQSVLLQGKVLGDTPAFARADSFQMQTLNDELRFHANRELHLSPSQHSNEQAQTDALEDASAGKSITIMGDESIPYAILKQLMQASAKAGFTNIALAVENMQSSGTALSSQAMVPQPNQASIEPKSAFEDAL